MHSPNILIFIKIEVFLCLIFRQAISRSFLPSELRVCFGSVIVGVIAILVHFLTSLCFQTCFDETAVFPPSELNHTVVLHRRRLGAAADIPLPNTYGCSGSTAIWGVGSDDLMVSFRSAPFQSYVQSMGSVAIIIVGKTIACCVAFASGGSGGVFAPGLVIGGFFGVFWGLLMQATGLETTTDNNLFYVLFGMAGLFSSITRLPLTSVLVVYEMSHTPFTSQVWLTLPMLTCSMLKKRISSVDNHAFFWKCLYF